MSQKKGYPQTEADKTLLNLIRAKFSLIYVVTWEEKRVISALSSIIEDDALNIGSIEVWDSARGLCGAKGNPLDPAIRSAADILNHISMRVEESRKSPEEKKAEIPGGPIFVLCDFFRALSTGCTPEIERMVRVLSQRMKRTSICVVITSPTLCLPLALEKSVAVVDYPLPDNNTLGMLVQASRKVVEDKGIIDKYEMDEEKVVDGLRGLTMQEAEDALANASVKTRKFDLDTILEQKKQIIRKNGTLDVISTDETMFSVGGLAGIKQFIQMRKDAYSEKARAYGLPIPKGLFLLGIQGTGKSLIAKVISKEFGCPLLKLDMGRLFGSLQGESEGNARQAMQLAEAVSPCVLLIDEIDKGFAGATGMTTDSGTTKRVLGSILNWMQEKKSAVFIVACANSTKDLPPELLRRGRFDESFFVDLPRVDERTEIWRIHLSKRNRDPNKFTLAPLASITEGFSGAEIEACVVDAMHLGFSKGREIEMADLEWAVAACKPLSKVMKEEIDLLRETSLNRMRDAGVALELEYKTEQQQQSEDWEKRF